MADFPEKLTNWTEEFIEWIGHRWTQIIIPLSIALTVAFFVQNPFVKDVPVYRLGEIAKGDIKAPSQMFVVDEDLTKKRQLQAEDQIEPVFDYDPQIQTSLSDKLDRAFAKGRAQPESVNLKSLEEELGIDLKDTDLEALKKYRFGRRLQQLIERILADAYSSYIIEKLPQEWESFRSITLRDLYSEQEQDISKQSFQAKLHLVSDVKKKILEDAELRRHFVQQFDLNRFQLSRDIAAQMITGSISFNQLETSARKEEARAKVEPVVVEIAKGEMIIREGERVERKHILFLESLRNIQQSQADLRTFIGFSALIFILIYIFHWVGTRNFKKFRFSSKDRMVLGGFFVCCVGLLTALDTLFQALQTSSSYHLSLSMFLPFAFVGMTLRLFSSMEIVFFFNLLFAVCVSWLLKSPYLGLTSLTVSMVGAAGMRRISQRLDVFKVGFLAGLVQAACVCLGVIMNLTDSAGISSPWVDLLATAGLSLCSGLFFSSAIVLFAQPIIEFMGYTTDLRLMELSNTNHPLLKELIMKAPGSYFHSFAVSQLSEKAAEAINANPLFARVAALYHDVGKTKKPQYFIENIKGENKHDKIVPTMSALIISNHVKEGIDLAQQYKLPQSIIDCIPQHHGTSLISYFFEKAKEASKGSGEEVDDRDFRYPGPKPQTKEAAIIMLADAVEATAKSMSQTTPDQLRQKVNQTIRRFFLDGQLDECDLSLKDLNAIGNAFVTVLQGIYHQRIDYPHIQNEDKKPDPEDSLLKRAGN